MRRALLVLVVSTLALPASGQDLRSPSGFLGYGLGTRFTPHHRVLEYVDHVAAASDRVRVERYGESVEGRPLALAFVASPENLARLDDIRRDNLRRTGEEEGEPAGALPAIVWLSYNVHGNEAVSTEAAMQTLYDLARTDHPDSREWLESVVVVIDPCLNPDGRERYVSWYNRTVGAIPDPDPAAAEHHEEWPGGRTNHYFFDLNRDWTWLTQQETRARIAQYNRWMPHVHVDFHEQGVDEPYYFAPAAEPYHTVVSAWQREFQREIGTNHAEWFDSSYWLYFTRERFDLFYPGYGDTYPTYGGAIGMTYEQGGSGRAGLGIETAEGDTLTLVERIEHHHATSLSTVQATARHAERVVQEFEAWYDAGAGDTRWRTFVLRAESGEDRLAAVRSHLDALGIRSGSMTGTRRVRGHDYRTGRETTVEIGPGDLVVPMDQPRGVLAGVLMEPDPVLPDSATYDITAWALPYAYGIDAVSTREAIAIDRPWSAASAALPDAGERPYAYLSAWSSQADLRFLARVLRAGISVRVATEAFRAAGMEHAPGTLVITRAGNARLGERFDGIVLDAARAEGRQLRAVTSGMVESGSDFGSSSVRFVRPPRIAMAFGEGTSSASVGEIWHWFDEQVGYPVTRIPASSLGTVALDEFDVVILPSGSYRELLDDRGLSRLREWVAGGGRLVAVGQTLSILAGRDGFALRRMERPEDRGDSLRSYADRERADLVDAVPGTVFSTRVDATHPLGFGLERGYFTLRLGSDAYAFLAGDRAWNVGVVQKDARRSGFVGHRAFSRLENTLAFGVEEIGRGAVVYLVDDPLYRAFWYEGRLLFGNAVFMPLR
jgi:hypothetical protein